MTDQSGHRIPGLAWQRGLSPTDRVSKVVSVCDGVVAMVTEKCSLLIGRSPTGNPVAKAGASASLELKTYTNTALQVLISTTLPTSLCDTR